MAHSIFRGPQHFKATVVEKLQRQLFPKLPSLQPPGSADLGSHTSFPWLSGPLPASAASRQ